jgi:hypothetical protein
MRDHIDTNWSKNQSEDDAGSWNDDAYYWDPGANPPIEDHTLLTQDVTHWGCGSPNVRCDNGNNSIADTFRETVLALQSRKL